MSLALRPMTLKAAVPWVKNVHRHLKREAFGLFAVGAEQDGDLVAVAIVARPNARLLQDGRTAEITRLATIGTFNACSILYGACRRAAKALGYQRLYTYTLEWEYGASLRAAGFIDDGITRGGEANRPSRARAPVEQPCAKRRWRAW